MLPVVAVIVKWCAQHPSIVRYGLLVLIAAGILCWAYQDGSRHATRQELKQEIITATRLKEEYDEISNRRPDDRGILDLLRTGAF